MELSPDSILGTWVLSQIGLKKVFGSCSLPFVTPNLKSAKAPRAAGAEAVLGREALGRQSRQLLFSAGTSLSFTETPLRISKRI